MSSKKKSKKKLHISFVSGEYDRNQTISTLQLPLYIEYALLKSNIITVGKLLKAKRKRLLKINNLGNRRVNELMKIKHNLNIKTLSDLPVRTAINTNVNLNKQGLIKIENKLIPEFLSPFDSIKILDLDTRYENSIRKKGIEKMYQLYNYPPNKLMKIPNIGPKTVNYLNKVISTVKLKTGKPNVTKNINIPNESLIELLFKRSGNIKAEEVIKRRYGLITGEKETLEEIGQSFGVTRERIRQIQSKALKRIKHPSNLAKKQIIKLVDSLFYDNGTVISSEEADKIIPKVFTNFSYDGSSLLDLLADLDWVQRYLLGAGDFSLYSSKVSNLKLPEIDEEIIEVLKTDKTLLSPAEIINHIKDTHKGDFNKLNLVLLVQRLCRLDPRIEEKVNGKFTLYSNHGRTAIWVHLISQILDETGIPLHFTEISAKVNEVLISEENKLDARRAHSILIENANFAHTGLNGMFGLTKWGLRKESTIDLAKEYIQNAGFPVHWKQIYDYVSRYKDSPKQNITAILEQSGQFTKTGNGFYDIKK